jgi:hypothetical protein
LTRRSSKGTQRHHPGGGHGKGGNGFTAAWITVAGLGLGLAMPTAMNAAIGAISAERSGTGSALISAMRQVGATIGVAVLGTVLNSAYRGRLDLAGLPGHVADVVRQSVAGGIAVAHAAGSALLLGTVRTAYLHALDLMLLVCGAIAVTAVLLALAFLPRRRRPEAAAAEPARPPSEVSI